MDLSELSYLDFDADFSAPRVVDAYDELPLWSAMFGLLLLEHVPLAGVRTALDAGCGTGFPLNVTLNVTLHEGSAASMPFAPSTFDLIVCGELSLTIPTAYIEGTAA